MSGSVVVFARFFLPSPGVVFQAVAAAGDLDEFRIMEELVEDGRGDIAYESAPFLEGAVGGRMMVERFWQRLSLRRAGPRGDSGSPGRLWLAADGSVEAIGWGSALAATRSAVEVLHWRQWVRRQNADCGPPSFLGAHTHSGYGRSAISVRYRTHCVPPCQLLGRALRAP